MQGEILLVNPRRRKRSHRARGAGGRFVKTHRARRKNSRRRRRNPIAAIAANPRRRRRRRNPVAALAVNPRRRRRHHRKHRVRARRRNPRFAMAGVGSLKRMLVPAGLGALGAVALDAAMAAATPYIPAQLQSGPLKMVTRVLGAFGLGWAAGKIKPDLRTPVILGGLTVAAYFAARDLAARFAPQIPLQGYMEGDVQLGYIDPAPALQGHPGSMGAYMTPGGGDLGAYMTPGGDLGNMTSDGM